MTIDLELLNDLPNLEVINNGNVNYYETIDITNGELTVVNIGDDTDEFYLKNYLLFLFRLLLMIYLFLNNPRNLLYPIIFNFYSTQFVLNIKS